MDEKVIKGHIKTLRLNYLTRNAELYCTDFIPGEKIGNNLEKLSQILGVNSSQEINWNLSNNELYLWAEMFINLNSCPSFYVKLYKKAIYGTKSRIATIAAKIIKKTRSDFSIKAMKIFSSVFGFQYISHYSDENESINKNIVNVEGKIIYVKINCQALVPNP